MLRVVLIAFFALAVTPASAQVLGSVHCKASLRQIDIDLKATQRRLDAVQTQDDKCSAMRVHVLTLERASQIFARCTEGPARDENVGQAENSAADTRILMERGCGG
jgi:hypothetical protein